MSLATLKASRKATRKASQKASQKASRKATMRAPMKVAVRSTGEGAGGAPAELTRSSPCVRRLDFPSGRQA